MDSHSLTRTQFLKIVFTVAAATMWAQGHTESQDLSISNVCMGDAWIRESQDQLVMSVWVPAIVVKTVCLVFPEGRLRGKCWLAPNGHHG